MKSNIYALTADDLWNFKTIVAVSGGFAKLILTFCLWSPLNVKGSSAILTAKFFKLQFHI